VVLRTGDTQGIESFLGEHRVDLLIIEIAEKRDLSDDLIKRLRSRLPRMLILIVNGNGNREVIARAFSDGIVDAFHRPYDPHLIAERAIAILREMDKP
jgi:DNA-binding response OmpR family regulator